MKGGVLVGCVFVCSPGFECQTALVGEELAVATRQKKMKQIQSPTQINESCAASNLQLVFPVPYAGTRCATTSRPSLSTEVMENPFSCSISKYL